MGSDIHCSRGAITDKPDYTTTYLGGNINVLVEINREKLNELFYQVSNLHGTECPLHSSGFSSITLVHRTLRNVKT